MDNYDIIERGKELYETENSAYNRGDIVGMASAQQAMLENEDQFLSLTEPVVEKEPNKYSSMFSRVLAGVGLLIPTILGAGIAKDLMPQDALEDRIIYDSDHNSEDDDFYTGKHVAIEPDFHEGGAWNPLSQASIVDMKSANITMGGGAIDFSEVSNVRVEIDNNSLDDIYGLHDEVKWDYGDVSNLSFSKVSDDLYKVEFDTKLQIGDWSRQGNRSIDEWETGIEEYIGVDHITSDKIVFERVWRDIDNDTIINRTLEEVNIGDQMQFHGGTNVTLDSIYQTEWGELIGNFSGRQSWHLTSDELNNDVDLDIALYFEGDNHRIWADFDSRSNNRFELNLREGVNNDNFQLGLEETKTLTGESMTPITVTREWSQDSDYRYQLNIEFTNVFGEEKEEKMWFNHSYDSEGNGRVTGWKGDIPGLDVRMYDDHSFRVEPDFDLDIDFDENMDITAKTIYGNETDSQRFFEGTEPLVLYRGSVITKTNNQNNLTLNINSADLDLQSPQVNGIEFYDNNGEYTFVFFAHDENLKNLEAVLCRDNPEGMVDIVMPGQVTQTQFDSDGRIAGVGISIPKEDLTEGNYRLNVTAEDDVGNLVELSKRVVVASLGDVSLQSLITAYDSDNNIVTAFGQMDGSSSNKTLDFIVENETGDVIFSKEFFSSELGNNFVISEEVNLTGGRYTAKLQTNKTEHSIITQSHFRAPFTYGPNATNVNEDNILSWGEDTDFEPHSVPEITIKSITPLQGTVGSWDNVEGNASELVEIVTDIDGVEYNFTNLVPRVEQNETFWDRDYRIWNEIREGQPNELVGVQQISDGVFVGFSYYRDHNSRTNETIFNPTPHVWVLDTHQISSASEKPFIGLSESDVQDGSGWNWKNGIRPVEVLPDGTILIEEVYGITYVGGDLTSNEFHADSLTVVNAGEVYRYGWSSIDYKLFGSRSQITETLESKFDVWRPPVSSEPEPLPEDNNTNETIPEHEHENNNTNESNETETNETVLYVPRENDLIVRSFNCDSSYELGNPKTTRWALDIINPNNDRVYITTNTGKVLAYHNSDPEHFDFLHFDVNGSEYLELRTLATPGFKVEDSEIMERGFNASEFEKYGYSNHIRLTIPNLDSCELTNPLAETPEDNAETEIQSEDGPDIVKWAAYSAAAASGVLSLNVLANILKKRSGKNKEDDLGKWDATDDLEGEMDLQDLDVLATGLNGEDQLYDSQEYQLNDSEKEQINDSEE